MKKMNNKGQVLVVFVIILPLVLLLIGTFINKSYIYYEKTKIDNILNLACESNDIITTIKNNDPKIKSEVTDDDGKIIITAKKKINNNTIKVVKVCEE